MSASTSFSRLSRVPVPGGSIVRRSRGLFGLGQAAYHFSLLRLGGLGETDDDLAIRTAALEQSRRDRLQRVYDSQDAAMRAKEREEALKISQEFAEKAAETQTAILEQGQTGLNKVAGTVIVVAGLSLGAYVLTSVLSRGKRRRKSSRSRSRSTR